MLVDSIGYCRERPIRFLFRIVLLSFSCLPTLFCQQELNLTIAGQNIHLVQRPGSLAIRVVKPSVDIAVTERFTNVFQTVQARTPDAGLLGISKSTIAGALPSSAIALERTNQIQQVPVYATDSDSTDVALFPELIVQFREGTGDDVARQRLRVYGAQVATATRIPGRYIVSMPHPESVVAATKNMPKFVKEILYVEPNFYFIHRSNSLPLKPSEKAPAPLQPSTVPAANSFPDQWTLSSTPIDFGIVHSWTAFSAKGDNVRVAIVDDGVDLNHEDLKDAIESYWDTTTRTPIGTTSQLPYILQPEAVHGTACAGIIAGRAFNGNVMGVAPNVKIIAIKAANYVTIDGEPQWVNSTAALADALDKASELGADIISASWGMPNGLVSQDIALAIDRSLNGKNKRLVLLFAAGNVFASDQQQKFDMDFPASLAATKLGVISVAASSPCDELKSYSSCDNQANWSSRYLPVPTIVAPGTAMQTTIPNNSYSSFSGTSAATPFAAGVIALLMSKEPLLTREQIVSRITHSARSVAMGNTRYPRLDAFCALSGDSACQN